MSFYLDDIQTAITAIRKVANEAQGYQVYQFSGMGVTLNTLPRFEVQVRFLSDRTDVAGFTLVEQVNCCGALVSTKTYVHRDWKGKGIAQFMQPIKLEIAKMFGYSSLAATVNMTGNPAEVHILEKCGWVKGFEFKNSRTGNQVGFFFKEVKK